ncbi:MAG: hypothetical protein ABI876_12065 [Bacteroidota bacterium]
MDFQSIIEVTSDNWPDVVNRIDWRHPEVVDRTGNRFLQDVDGGAMYSIPIDVWYERNAYRMVWRRFVAKTAQKAN